MPIIEVKHLTKEYQLGHLTSFKETALNSLRRLTFQPIHEQERFKALDDVNFTIEEGEVVGIIGHNGAGKSTLLKHLASISKPTKGKVIVRGSVAPLIEVGAGVNPELTGRENIFLNGAILGIPKKIIQQKLDEIIDFSELEQFIDTPVKRYSSGMTVKLGFSIATSMDADILIIDEVLAVGDLAFQRKCFDRMEDLIKRQGKTVLLVSHNIRQVERLCKRTILLENGRITLDDEPSLACSLFYEHANAKIINYGVTRSTGRGKIESSGEIEILSVGVVDPAGQKIGSIKSGSELRVRVQFKLSKDMRGVEMVVGTHSTDFVYLSASSTGAYGIRPDLSAGIHEVEYIIPSFPLVAGVYCIRFSVYDINMRPVFVGETLEIFKVTAETSEVREPGSRILHIPAQWRLDGQTYQAHDPVDTAST